MGKASKRERKFKAKGGVKKRLEKGTITKKGKLPQRQRGNENSRQQLILEERQKAIKEQRDSLKNKKRVDDFLGEDNIAELDIDSFFAKMASEIEKDNNMDEKIPSEHSESDSESIQQDSGGAASSDHQNSEDEEEIDDEDDDDDSIFEDAHLQAESRRNPKVKSSDFDSISEDSDDEDNVEVAEARMKAEMKKMQQVDPEFHEFLQENEQSLLDFGDDEGDDNDYDDNEIASVDADGNDSDAGSKPKKASHNQVRLTAKLLTNLETGAFRSHGLKSLRKLVVAYKSACHLADSSKEDDSNTGAMSFLIDSSKIFDELMLMCLGRIHEELYYHLIGPARLGSGIAKDQQGDNDEVNAITDDDSPLNPSVLEKAEKWVMIRPMLRSFFQSSLHLLLAAKEPELLTFILKSLAKYVRFLTPFPRIAESMLRILTSLWSAPLDTSEDYQVVRLNAFFRIRQLALTQPFPFVEDILKKTYLAYARRAKFGTSSAIASVLPTLTFMGNCLCEFYRLDYHSSYQHAFVYIRQLALLLRSAIHKKTAEAMQQVYCWQYIHCLKLWVAVLCDAISLACEEEKPGETELMRSLIYPLSEVICGTIRLVPSPARHVPLRFHCVRMLQKLAASAQVFIPTASILLDCLDWKEWYLSPKKASRANAVTNAGSGGNSSMEFLLKLVPKEDALRLHEHRESSMNTLFLLLNRDVELYRFSAGFPEYAVRIMQRLKSFTKQASSQARWRSLAKSCVDVCEQYSTFAIEKRSKLLDAPKDVKNLECLLPIGDKAMRDRHNDSIEKENKQQQALARASAAATVNRKRSGDDNVEMENDNDDDNGARGKNKRKKRQKQKDVSKKHQENAHAFVASSGSDNAYTEADRIEDGVDWSDDE